MWLAAEAWRALGLVVAHSWAELGSGVGGCRASIPGYSVGLLVGGASS